MDLLIPVLLKNIPMDFEEYCSTVVSEQSGSIDWMASPGASWNVPGSLALKVSDRGMFKPFFGDTVVLPVENRDALSGLQARLHSEIPGLCAELLRPEFFHLTLHDLTSGTSLPEISGPMEKNRHLCEELFTRAAGYFSENPELARVTIRGTRVYPSVNVSLVLGFVPASEKDFRILMNLYNLFDRVVYLPYWLRLHITLCYFRPHEPTREEMGMLFRLLQDMSCDDLELTLDMRDLRYEHFSDMNRYETIFAVRDFL